MRFSYYGRLSGRQQAVYRRSDAIQTVSIPDGAPLEPLVRKIDAALAADDRDGVQGACQALTDELARRFAVTRIEVSVLAKRPLLRGGGDLMGLYEPRERGKPVTITLWMRTARRRQVVAFRTFLRTLLHEFCHHLDYEHYGLPDSFHTEGFYKRESALMQQLLPAPEA